ncbi:MAG: hypothetical protein PHS02_04485, partial [Candidatus ainarchaeum sp.]|nr:hypothetical protein [Candidatus ainarchaeum sp.]
MLAWLFLFLALYFASISTSVQQPQSTPQHIIPFQVTDKNPPRAYCFETGAQVEVSATLSKNSAPLASISIVFPNTSHSDLIPENLSRRTYGINFVPGEEGRYDVEFSSGEAGQPVETTYFYAYPPGSDPVELGYRCANIKGKNNPPELKNEISPISFEEGSSFALDLSKNFRDPDKDALNFSSSPSENLAVSMEGSTATISAIRGFTGSEEVVFYASDGRSTTPSNTVNVTVSPAPTNASNATVSTTQSEVRVGQPVRWKKVISLDSAQSVSFSIPSSASIISMEDKSDKKSIALGGSNAEKPGRQDEKIVDIGEPVKVLEVVYETPGPTSQEKPLGPTSKEVVVSSEVHYENISATSTLPAEVSDPSAIRLIWKTPDENSSDENSTETPVPFTTIDSDSNGLIDSIGWTVPSLSNQTYEISISVLNVHSYPTLYGNWTVEFTTLGEANLTITATNEPNYTSEYTRWSDSEEESYDLKFLELRCGNETLQYAWLGTGCLNEECSIFVENYSCGGTAYETSKVLSAKKHVLRFGFGDEIAYAYNDAANITINSIILNSSSGTNSTRENLTVYVNATDANGYNVSIAYDWRLSDTSIAVLNLNFDVNNSAGAGETRSYSTIYSNGTVNGAVWNSTGGFNGTGAYEFDGADDYINATTLNLGNAFTLEAWVKRRGDGHTSGRDIIQQQYGSGAPYASWGLSLMEDNRIDFFTGATDDSFTGGIKTPVLSLDTWYYVVATYSGSNKSIYINGLLVNSTSYSKTIKYSSDPFLLGTWTYNPTGNSFNGVIDGVRIYGRALSSQEILALYNNRSDLMVSQELALGQNWTACATPNDGLNDGTTNCSNALYVQS